MVSLKDQEESVFAVRAKVFRTIKMFAVMNTMTNTIAVGRNRRFSIKERVS
jgi:hypothetical protein